MSIRILPPQMAAQIAAGEVVERPLSVVKELVENALDAGASSIDIVVHGVHLDNIRVHDNGAGMDPDDLALTLLRHATSKLPEDDISNIHTLGYRGEALPSIAAVADVQIVSRKAGMDCAFSVSSRSGRLSNPKPSAGREGTLVEVAGLFSRHPARLKFQKSPKTEAAAIREVIASHALAHPHVEFKLALNGWNCRYPPRGKILDRIHDVLGSNVAGDAVELAHDHDGIIVYGAACIPSATRSDLNGIRCAVNGRPVTDKTIRAAVQAAYANLIGPGRHPQAYVSITVPCSFVDINVHPRKAEVRFMRPQDIASAVSRAIEGALAKSGLKTPTALPDLARTLSHASDTGADDPKRRPLGRFVHQINGSWLICETTDGIVIVDQHAAHERVILERLKAQLEGITTPVFCYPTPKSKEVSPLEAAAVDDALSSIRAFGFSVDVAGNKVTLHSVPAVLADCSPEELLHLIVQNVSVCLEDGLLKEVMWERLASAACKAAIKAGHRLTSERADTLLREIEATPNASYCNHGRPTVAFLTDSQIAKLFARG